MRIISTAFVLLLLCILPSQASAQDYLLDDNIKIQRHDKRTSAFRFARGEKTAALDRWGMQFEQSVWNTDTPEEARLISYEKLPRCENKDVKLHEIFHHTGGTDSTDVLYYSASDSSQKKEAAHYPNFKVAYQPALMRDSSTNQAEYWQMFARFVRIECLPTRFRFTYIGSERYMEYRLGDAAWESTAK